MEHHRLQDSAIGIHDEGVQIGREPVLVAIAGIHNEGITKGDLTVKPDLGFGVIRIIFVGGNDPDQRSIIRITVATDFVSVLSVAGGVAVVGLVSALVYVGAGGAVAGPAVENS